MYEINTKIKSVCPYIQNKPEEKEWVVGPDGNWTIKNPPGTVGKKSVNPEDAGWKDEKGYFIPSGQIFGAMRERSGGIKLGKGKMTLKNLFISCVRIEPDKIYLNKKKPDRIYDKPCFKPTRSGGEMVFTPRPMFDSFEVKIKIVVLEDSIPKEAIMECLKNAGLYQGIGSRRPLYGRFMVVS